MDRIKFETGRPVVVKFKSNEPTQRTEQTKWGDKTYMDWEVKTKGGQDIMLSATSYLNDSLIQHNPEAGTVLTITMKRENNKVSWVVTAGDGPGPGNHIMVPDELPTMHERSETMVHLFKCYRTALPDVDDEILSRFTISTYIDCSKANQFTKEGTARDIATPMPEEEDLPF